MAGVAGKVARGTVIGSIAGLLLRSGEGTHMVQQTVHSLARGLHQIPGGDIGRTAVRELMNVLPGDLRSGVEPLILHELYGGGRPETEGDMEKKKKDEGGKQQGGGSNVGKAIGTIAQLNPTAAQRIRAWLRTAGELKDAILERIGTGFNVRTLQSLSEQYGENATLEDIRLIFGVEEPKTPGAEAKKSETIEVKGTAVLCWQNEDVQAALFEVLADPDNNRPDERQRFFQTLANVYGDGKEEAQKASKPFCAALAALPLEGRKVAMGIHKNPVQQITSTFKRAVKGQPPTRQRLSNVLAAMNLGRERRGMPPLVVRGFNDGQQAMPGATLEEEDTRG